ncbi:glycosyltransferase family 39 protein [Flavobacteriaceae bacterium F08102]|nr:glycosyltransferase family 39 protein [Flavobacteriaceae bacterium F08102]
MTFKNSIDRYYFLGVFILFIVLIIGLGSYGLAETSEARYAEISREMLLSGDYFNPELLGIYHFHKPPITYYITTLGYRLFGINEFGARFFLQIALVIQLLLIYEMAKLLNYKRKTALIAGLIYFSMPIVLISSRNLTTDAYLTTFIIASLFCWQYYTTKGKLLFLYLSYIFISIAILTKGPVALLFIFGYIIPAKIIFKRSWRLSIHHVLGIIFCLIISASWYVSVIIENPKLLDYFIKKQLISRMTKASFNRAKPFWYYLPILIGLLFPWWLSTLPNFKKKLKSIKESSTENKLLLTSSLVMIVLFSIFTTKLILYILPMFWMISIFIASQLARISTCNRTILSKSYLVLLTCISLGLFIIWIIEPTFIHISILGVMIAFTVNAGSFMVYYFINSNQVIKPAAMASAFSISLLLISAKTLSENSSLINSTKDMVHFIDHTSIDSTKTILVYDYLLSSIPMYTSDLQITLKYKHNTTARETLFENDQTYRDHLWDINEPAIIPKIDSISQKPNTFLMVRNSSKLAPELSFLKHNFNKTKHYPKWTIYYHR